jgi:predicted 2-oxoglutarate/Fe(II)-dependent dioxygenase YbiX
MSDCYVLIKKLYSSEDISLILDKVNNKEESHSKVGNRVSKEKKIRKDVFFSQSESKEMDKIYFNKIQKIVKEKFNLILKYRETYKLGTYYGDEKGFYIPHTDTQGIMQHRKISIVICLSKINDYEGGIFKFINLKKDFKFDFGDTIIFDSNILHGVQPVTSGKRQVLISFMWDEEGEQIRQKKNPTINNLIYLPNDLIISSVKTTINSQPENKIYNYDTFNNYHPKIISFSLWGDSEIYNYGMVENALIAKEKLPEFKIYLYYNNTILTKTFNILKKLDNVVLILVNNTEKSAINIFWRLTPCFYSNSIINIRDCDSLINERDIFVINSFINSEFDICSVKDNIAHLKYALVGGGWGCKNGILKKYSDYFNNYCINKLNIRGIDQDLLIQIYYENINNIELYIPKKFINNHFYEKKITYIENVGSHVVSYNYYTPKTLLILNEDNKKLSSKRFYSFGKDNTSFLNAFKLISLIPPDSGPGNQIIGIKECLILSKLLYRICIIPPIREHYLKSNTTFYNFNDIFTLNLSNIIVDNEHSEILNNIDNNTRYCIHNNFLKKKLRHEHIIDSLDNNEILLKCTSIKNITNLNEIQNIDDNLVIIKHLFNYVYINQSGTNGDFYSSMNTNFESIYSDICSNWDYSNYIKLLGNDYIKKTFNDLPYNAIHIRLPDIMSKSINEFTNNDYSDSKIVEIITKLKTEKNNQIFIASNNLNYLKKIGIVANYIDITNKHNSFIEQYICGMSEKFYYLNLENTRYNNNNNRSTWTSFVIDYRMFLRKLNNNFNLRN